MQVNNDNSCMRTIELCKMKTELILQYQNIQKTSSDKEMRVVI